MAVVLAIVGALASAFRSRANFCLLYTSASTLRYWASQLNRRRPGNPVVLSAPGAAVARVRMVRVRRKPRAASAESMVVWIGAACIELRAGFDRGLLREVVDALGAKP